MFTLNHTAENKLKNLGFEFNEQGFLQKSAKGMILAESLDASLVDQAILAFNTAPHQQSKLAIASAIEDYITITPKPNPELPELNFKPLFSGLHYIGRHWQWFMPSFLCCLLVAWPVGLVFLAIPLLIIPSLLQLGHMTLYVGKKLDYETSQQEKLDSRRLIELVNSIHHEKFKATDAPTPWNTNLLFQNTPPPQLQTHKLIPLPTDMLTRELIILCANPDLKSDFERHINSNYSGLIRQLRLIYYRLNGHLDPCLGPLTNDMRTALIVKLTEDIDQCTPGFQERVNSIVEGFQLPHSLPELLYLIRKRSIEKVVSSIASEVHHWNRIRNAALYYRPNTNAENSPITLALEKEFQENLTLLKLPYLLADELREVLSRIGYAGRNDSETGYPSEIAIAISDQIKCYLGTPDSKHCTATQADLPDWLYFFKLSYTADDIEQPIPYIRDLDWELITRHFFNLLIRENYLQITAAQVNSSNYSLFDLNHPAIVKNLLFLLPTIDAPLSAKLAQTIWPVLQQPIQPVDSATLLQVLLEKNKHDWTLFMSAVQYQPTFLNKFLGLLQQLLDCSEQTTLKQLFLAKNESGWHALLIAARHQPSSLELSLNFLQQRIEHIDSATLQQLFLEKNKSGCSTLLLAAQYQAVAVQNILTFIEQHIDRFDNGTLSQLFLEKNNSGYSALMLAAQYQAVAVQNILTFIEQHIDRFDNGTLPQLFLEKNEQDWNTLMLAVKYQPEVVQNMLIFIDKHIDLFNQLSLQQLFLEKSNTGWNALMLAVDYQFKAAQPILAFIDKHIETLGINLLERLLEDKGVNNGNPLIITACSYPEATKNILRFITTTPPDVLNKRPVAWASFILNQLARLSVANHEDKTLIDTMLVKHASLLLSYFSKDYFTNNPNHLAYVSDKLLENYLNELENRNTQNITHTSQFFRCKFGYSTQQKINAAKQLQNSVRQGKSTQELLNLRETDSALDQGRLGKLFKLCCQLKPATETPTLNNWQSYHLYR